MQNSSDRNKTWKRRDFLYGLGAGAGAVALSSLLSCESTTHDRLRKVARAIPKSPMFVPRAKYFIFLTLEGGPSHIDTFDPKPALDKYHLTKFTRSGKEFSAMSSGSRYFVKSPYQFNRVGSSGAEMCEHYVHLAEVADHICFYRGCQAESVNHPTAMYHLNTGNRFGGEPALGAWWSYGLGTLNEDLPSFVVLPEVAFPQGGAGNWSNGFLPPHFQGTPLRQEGNPILHIDPPPGVSHYHQRQKIDLLQELNHAHEQKYPHHEELSARIDNYELAYRMQTSVPGVLNIDGEPDFIREQYGLNRKETRAFGRKCLLARKLIEKGVRFVQIYSTGWDSHDFLERAHRNLITSIDKPIAGLIKDLDQRGMLDETLIVCSGEFGRTPDNGIREGGIAYGRDHNPKAMNVWLAGGGVRGGHTIGATDELGAEAVEAVHPLRDLHVTLMHLFGLDDNRLTYFHGGRYKQLSQFGGEVIHELIA